MPNATCNICISPNRKDIELAYKKGVKQSELVANFFPFIQEAGLITKKNVFRNALHRHFTKKHPPRLVDLNVSVSPEYKEKLDKQMKELAPEPDDKPENKQPTTFDEYAQKLLEMGFSAEMLNSKKLTPTAIIQAQKTLLEREKIKKQNSQLLTIMKKMMSGLITEEDEQRFYQLEAEMDGGNETPI